MLYYRLRVWLCTVHATYRVTADITVYGTHTPLKQVYPHNRELIYKQGIVSCALPSLTPQVRRHPTTCTTHSSLSLVAIIIAELNEKKNIAVEKAYKQVNKDFSSIFSTILPGATAKLAPPEGASCLDGLEVKVGFGDVWKESLTELSGGQR